MEKSSFFNSEIVNGEYDRQYLAEDFARYFSSFISNGVFIGNESNLQVTGTTNNMNIIVKSGKAWINGYFYENTEPLQLTIETAHGILNRIDTVVLRLDVANREIKTYLKVGTPSDKPTPQQLTRSNGIYELSLAEISILKGTTSINQSMITDTRKDKIKCGIVSGLIDQIDTNNLFAQFESAFEIWFEKVRGQLSTDAAGKLQLQLDSKLDKSQLRNEIKAIDGFGSGIDADLFNNKNINEFNKYSDTIDKVSSLQPHPSVKTITWLDNYIYSNPVNKKVEFKISLMHTTGLDSIATKSLIATIDQSLWPRTDEIIPCTLIRQNMDKFSNGYLRINSNGRILVFGIGDMSNFTGVTAKGTYFTK